MAALRLLALVITRYFLCDSFKHWRSRYRGVGSRSQISTNLFYLRAHKKIDLIFSTRVEVAKAKQQKSYIIALIPFSICQASSQLSTVNVNISKATIKLPAPNITSQLTPKSFPPIATERRTPRNTPRHFLGHHAVSTYKPSSSRYLFCGLNSLTGKLMFLVILMLVKYHSICI